MNEKDDVIQTEEPSLKEEPKSEEKQDNGQPSEGKRKLSNIFGLIFPLVGLGALLILFFVSSITRIIDLVQFIGNNIENNYWDNYFDLISHILFLVVTLMTTVMILIFFIGHFTSKYDGHKTIKKLPLISLASAAGLFFVMMLRIMHYLSLDPEYRPSFVTEIVLLIFCVLTVAASVVAISMKKPLLNKIFIAVSQGLSLIVLEILGFHELMRFAVPYELAIFFLLAMAVANFFILPREE